MSEPKELVLLTKAQRALAQANTVDEVKELRDRAAAVRAYVQKARLGKHLVIEAAAVRIRAERRLGQMLTETELAKSAPGNQYTTPSDAQPTEAVLLKDLGITKNESSRSQRVAELSDESFEQYLAKCVQTEREPTFAGLLRLLEPQSRPSPPNNDFGQSAANSDAATVLQIPESEYSTILAVPPWPGNEVPGQSPLTTDNLCDLPVGRQFGEHTHLYLWTSNQYLVDGFDIMDAWGFAYHTSFVVIHEDRSSDVPWGNTHYILLVGVRGDRQFRQCADHSWLVCEKPANGFVPEGIVTLIEAASPPPYLLLFGSQDASREGWTVSPLPSNQ
jgi:N6-adenosine-specific RNA methylase IME4